MGRISLNVSQEALDAVGTGFELIPAGKYKAEIFEIEDTEGIFDNNKGLPQANIQFRIAEGELDTDGKDLGNRRLFHQVPLHMVKGKDGSEGIPWQLAQMNKATGGDAETLNNLDTDDWVGEFVQVEVSEVIKKEQVDGKWVNKADGEKKNKIKSVRSLGSASAGAAAVAKAGGAKSKADTFKF